MCKREGGSKVVGWQMQGTKAERVRDNFLHIVRMQSVPVRLRWKMEVPWHMCGI